MFSSLPSAPKTVGKRASKKLSRRDRDSREDAVCKVMIDGSTICSGLLVEFFGHTAVLTGTKMPGIPWKMCGIRASFFFCHRTSMNQETSLHTLYLFFPLMESSSRQQKIGFCQTGKRCWTWSLYSRPKTSGSSTFRPHGECRARRNTGIVAYMHILSELVVKHRADPAERQECFVVCMLTSYMNSHVESSCHHITVRNRPMSHMHMYVYTLDIF